MVRDNRLQLLPDALLGKTIEVHEQLPHPIIDLLLVQVLAVDHIQWVAHLVRHRGVYQRKQLLLAFGYIHHNL
jgi:hypothetical protein